MKILHTADWHLDAPMTGYRPEISKFLQEESRKIPEKIVTLAKKENCNLLLIAGDIFDGEPSKECVTLVKNAFASINIPVIISPGNHDFCQPNSPYLKEDWPSNVHIFKKAETVFHSALIGKIGS